MRKVFCFLLCALLCAAGERASAQRRLPGQLAVELGGGAVDGLSVKKSDRTARWWASLGLSRCNGDGSRWVFSAEYLQKGYRYKTQVVPTAQYTADIARYFPLVSDRGGVFVLSAGLSALAGYETSGRGGKLLHDGARITDRDRFIWGGSVGVQAEAWLCDRLAFMLQVRERITGGSDIGTFRTLAGVGLKIVIR